MGSEIHKAAGEPGLGNISIDSSQFIDLVASKAADRAHDRMERSFAPLRAALKWLGVLVGIVAVAGISAAAFFDLNSSNARMETKLARAVAKAMAASEAKRGPELRAEIDRAVANALKGKVDARIKEVVARLDSTVAYLQLLALTTQLEIKDSFSNSDRDLVLSTLAQLKAQGGYMDRPGFDHNLKKIVDSFTSAYQVAAVDRLDTLFRDDLSAMEDVPRWLTNHFGRALVTSDDIRDRSSMRWERHRYYSDVTKQNRSPEISLLWELIAQFVLSDEQKSPKVDALVERITLLSQKDRKIFNKSLLEEGTASERDPPDMRRVAKIVTGFIALYKQELTALGLEVE